MEKEKEKNNYKGKLKYEGEFLNGKINWKGKEYCGNSELKFEDEYLNGDKHEKGKEYNVYGYLIFEGEYLYDFRLKGKLFKNGKFEYESEYLNNKKWNGKGFDENGNIIYELINGNGNENGKEYDDFSALEDEEDGFFI